jgi:hypothetical protein
LNNSVTRDLPPALIPSLCIQGGNAVPRRQ